MSATNQRKFSRIFLATVLSSAAWLSISNSARAEEVWGVDSAQDALYSVDLDTGAATLVGPLHADPTRFTTPVSMAVRPSDGAIFVNNNSPSDDDGLATVDPVTGLATLVNPGLPPGGDYIDGAMAFDDLGNLYAADLTGALAMVDQNTGAANSLGGPVLPRLFGLDFNPGDNRLYGATHSVSGFDLLKINPATGVLEETIAVDIAPQPPGAPAGTLVPGSLLFDSSGTLHGTIISNPAVVFEIDPGTGATSNLRTITAGFGPQGMGLMITPGAATIDLDPGDVEFDAGFISAMVENVVQAGTIDFDFCVAVVDHWVGKWFIPLSRYSNSGTCGALPHDVLLPPGFKPFIAQDGSRKIGIVTGDSSVIFNGLILEEQNAQAVLGFDPACDTDLPVALGVSDLDVANRILKLQTGECNRPRSARSSYSTTVFPMQFTGNGTLLALARATKIQVELFQATCIASVVRTQLKQQARQIKKDIWRRRNLAAQEGYVDFAVTVQENPAAFASCPVINNYGGLLAADGIIGAFIVSEYIRGEEFRIPPDIMLP